MIDPMSEFLPECTIHVSVASEGKPARLGWAVVLVDKRGRDLVSALRFRGNAGRIEVFLEAVFWGLEQAARLKSEKVHLNLPPGSSLDFLENRVSKSRDPELRAWENKIKETWAAIRLSKIVGTGEHSSARDLAKRAAKGVRRWEDMDV